MSDADLLHRRHFDQFNTYGPSSDGSPNWVVTGGTWTVTGGKYQAVTSAVGHKSVKASLTLRDMRVEFVVNWTTANNWDVGFFFRGAEGDEANDCYFVTLESGGLYLKKYVAGTPTTLDSYAFSPATSTNYTILIWCEGTNPTNIIVYLDGTQRLSATDSSSPLGAGTLGFVSQSSGSETVTFDDVDIWGIEEYVHNTYVKKGITDKIKRFHAIVDNMEGLRTGRYKFGDDIEVWRNGKKIFAGMLEYMLPQSKTGTLIDLKGRDYTAKLLYRYCTETYSSQELATTLKDLLTKYAPDFGQTNIDNTGISLAPEYRERQLYAIGRELADMGDFEIWTDADQELYFKPRTYEDSGVVFSEASNIIDYEIPMEGEQIYTTVKVFGASGVAVKVENSALVDELGYVREAHPIVDPAIATNAEAKKRGEAYLAKSVIPNIIKIQTWGQETLKEATLAKIYLTDENLLNAEYLILEIEYITPGFPSTIVTLAKYSEGIEEIIRKLREDLNAILANEMDLTATLEWWLSLYADIEVKVSHITIKKRTSIDAFILGDDTYGVLGAGGYGLGDRSGEWITEVDEEDP